MPPRQPRTPRAASRRQKTGRRSIENRTPAPPPFVAPQLATLVAAPPTGEGWVHEIKFDGYRLLARIADGAVALITRADNDWTGKFAALAEQLAALKVDNALLDGEVVHEARNGRMSFHALQQALSTGKKQDLHYYAFDLLFLDGVDLRERSLLERKAALAKIVGRTHAHIHYSEHFGNDGKDVLARACGLGLEGIVSKRARGAYSSGRGDAWQKSKCFKEQELVIGGFTEQPKHPGELGALLMGYFERDAFLFAGKVGTGFSHPEGRALLKRLKALEQKASPFRALPTPSRRGARFVEPTLVAQVNFAEWTSDGRMRHPSFQGLREDKPARQVVRERST